MTFEQVSRQPKTEEGQSTLKSNNYNSNFETIKEEDPSPLAGNHQQSPKVRPP
jgi:hypothetical protein